MMVMQQSQSSELCGREEPHSFFHGPCVLPIGHYPETPHDDVVRVERPKPTTTAYRKRMMWMQERRCNG